VSIKTAKINVLPRNSLRRNLPPNWLENDMTLSEIFCMDCGLEHAESKMLYEIEENKEAFKRLLFRLNDATQEVNAGDRATLIRLLEPVVK